MYFVWLVSWESHGMRESIVAWDGTEKSVPWTSLSMKVRCQTDLPARSNDYKSVLPTSNTRYLIVSINEWLDTEKHSCHSMAVNSRHTALANNILCWTREASLVQFRWRKALCLVGHKTDWWSHWCLPVDIHQLQNNSPDPVFCCYDMLERRFCTEHHACQIRNRMKLQAKGSTAKSLALSNKLIVSVGCLFGCFRYFYVATSSWDNFYPFCMVYWKFLVNSFAVVVICWNGNLFFYHAYCLYPSCLYFYAPVIIFFVVRSIYYVQE